MTEADLDAVVTVEQECFRLPWTLGNFRQELLNPRARLFVAEAEGGIAGYLGAWNILGEYELGNLAVRQSYRRRGYARALLRTLIETAAAENAARVSLEVRVGNAAARALYAGFGFVEVGRRPRYYLDGEDALILAKKL